MDRNEAIEKGLKTYFSNKSCKKCGCNEKYVSNYTCVKCTRQSGKEKLNDNELMAKYRTKEKNKIRVTKWRKNNQKKVKEQYKRQIPNKKIYYQKLKDKFRNKALKRNYGINIEEYNILFKEQNGKCGICGCESNERMLAVDHCHNTGKIRGLLCTKCNTGIGLLKTEENMFKAIDYIRKT